MDFRLELVLIPVSDVDRAKQFYTEVAGFTLVVDGRATEGARIVQVTPPGSSFAGFSDPDGNTLVLQEVRRDDPAS